MSGTSTPSSPIHTPVTEPSPEEGMVDPLELTSHLTIQIPQVEQEPASAPEPSIAPGSPYDETAEEPSDMLQYERGSDTDESAPEMDPISMEDEEEDFSESDIEFVEEALAIETEEEKEANKPKNKKESYDCGVCYKTLTMDDNVVTKCDHHYCKDCFYRWIQTNASCPMCRTPITSNAHFTEDQLQMALSEEYSYYVHVLTKSNKMLKTNMRLTEKRKELLVNTNNLLRRQITLREQMDLTQATTDGIIACREKMLNNNNSVKKQFEKQYFNLCDGKFYHSFHKGYKEEKERLQDIAFNTNIVKTTFSFKPKKKVVIRKRMAAEVPVFEFCAAEKKTKTNHEEKTSAAAPASSAETADAIAEAINNAMSEPTETTENNEINAETYVNLF